MLHKMNLNPEPFELIKRGLKTIELRLYDEKRQLIQVGDTILFMHTEDSSNTMSMTVTALHRFRNFAELYAALPLDRCGYTPDEVASASPMDMNQYYSPEQQMQYGVVGIELQRNEEDIE